VRQRFPLVALAFLAFTPVAHAAGSGPAKDASGAYVPVDGTELLRAVELAKADTASAQVIIKLQPTTYEIDAPIVLGATDHVLIEPNTDATLDIDPDLAGNASIQATGSATTLLQLGGIGNAVAGIEFRGPTSATTAFPLVKLTGDATISGGTIQVGPGASSVTAVAATGTGNTLASNLVVQSFSTSSPAVSATRGITLESASIYGGSPALLLDSRTAGTAAATSTLSRAYVEAAGGAASVAVRTGSGPATLTATSTQLVSTDEGSAALSVLGASGTAGSVAVTLDHSDLIDGSGTASGTGVQVTPGAESTATTVRLSAVFAALGATAVKCTAGGSTAAKVTISTMYRDPEVLSPLAGACTISESGLVSGHLDQAFTADGNINRGYDSPLVDAAPPVTDADALDLFGAPRTSTGPHSPAATPTDIGAVEYQYLAPVFNDVTQSASDDHGLVEFTADAYDPASDTETTSLVYTWHFPDGSTQTGATAQSRFASATPGDVTVTVTDVTGMSTTESVTPTPRVQPPNLGTQPEYTELPKPSPKDPDPTTPAATTPPGNGTPLNTSTPTIWAFKLVRSHITTRSKSATGSGATTRNDGELQVTLSQAATLTVSVMTHKKTKLVTVPGAKLSFKAAAGTTVIRLTTRVSKGKLHAGLYRVTLLAQPASGARERRDVLVRVTK
jgi:hypothetical protein